jgi:hypothetical protein
MLKSGQVVRVNLAGLQAEGVLFPGRGHRRRWPHCETNFGQPPKYLVKLLFSFRGVSEVEVPADRIHGDK